MTFLKCTFRFLLLLIIVITFYLNLSFTDGDFFSIKLPQLDNNTFSFTEFKNKKGTVIIFLLSDCPASESYTLTLNKLYEKYGKNFSFAGIFPGTYSTGEELVKFQVKYQVNFMLLKDPMFVLAKHLHAEIAPGCFVINESGKVVYQGRIDDWLYALGKKKQVITENNLEDALKAMINKTKIKKSVTKPIGCILEYDK